MAIGHRLFLWFWMRSACKDQERLSFDFILISELIKVGVYDHADGLTSRCQAADGAIEGSGGVGQRGREQQVHTSGLEQRGYQGLVEVCTDHDGQSCVLAR